MKMQHKPIRCSSIKTKINISLIHNYTDIRFKKNRRDRLWTVLIMRMFYIEFGAEASNYDRVRNMTLYTFLLEY